MTQVTLRRTKTTSTLQRRYINLIYDAIVSNIRSNMCLSLEPMKYDKNVDKQPAKGCNLLLPLSRAQGMASHERALKDVRANCFCASLLRTKFTRHVMHRARALSSKVNNNRANGHRFDFAWI